MPLTLERYAEAAFAVRKLRGDDAIQSALAAMGVTKEEWEETIEAWAPKLEDPDRLAEFHELYFKVEAAAQARIVVPKFESPNFEPPNSESLSFQVLVAGAVSQALATTKAEDAVTKRLDIANLVHVGPAWAKRMEANPWLKTTFALLVQKGMANTCDYVFHQQRLRPGELVRVRRCPFCMATKGTATTSAYIYCDYCGRLFDYDDSKISQDPRSVQHYIAELVMNEVTIPQQKAAFEDGDKEMYARLMYWKNALMMDVCPAFYSPRIADPVYRKRLLEDTVVPMAVESRFDEASVLAGRAARTAQMEANASLGPNGLNVELVLRAFEVTNASFEIDAAIYERQGIFAIHPDQTDRELYLYMNRSIFVRPFLGFLYGDDGDRLLEAAGVTAEYKVTTVADLESRGCGNCASKVLLPPGATETLCEACGHMLSNRILACTDCGSGVAVPREATDSNLKCAFCSSEFRLA